MVNPFIIGIVQGNDFCNREKELRDLKKYATNGQNVVFYSPRRYGKSSLIQVLLAQLRNEGFLTVYVDLFSITSHQDFISKLATGIVEGIGRGASPLSFKDRLKNIFIRFVPTIEITPEGMGISVKFDKDAKIELLVEDIFRGMYRFIEKNKLKVCIALDEFQEITELNESKKIEGLLRFYMQSHKNVSFFFIGSRRRILKDMFTDKKRPFYKSAFLYELLKISERDFVPYIVEKFKKSGKRCPEEIAQKIWRETEGYPYYVQKLSYLLWDITQKVCDDKLLKEALERLIKMELPDFEGVWSGLTLIQKTFLKALAEEPTSSPFSMDYMKRYGLSQGGLQKAMASLISKDLIEKNKEGIYRIVDPVMVRWLCSV